MKIKEMRFCVPEDLYDQYRIICISLNLSVPRQTAELIRIFIEKQEENARIYRELKKKK